MCMNETNIFQDMSMIQTEAFVIKTLETVIRTEPVVPVSGKCVSVGVMSHYVVLIV